MQSDASMAGANQDSGGTVEELKRELIEAHQREAATAEVLRLISRSANELQPVLDTMLQTAARLCEAELALFFKLQDGSYHLDGSNNTEAAHVKYLSEHPIRVDRGSLVGRTALERRTVHLPDCLADPEYTRREEQRVGKYRSMLGVPLLRDGVPIGVIGLQRTVVKPFTEKQIQLVTTFADHALIAIKNARLFEAERMRTRELAAALQQQTVTADALKVISRSTFDLHTVLDTLAESAARLCEADMAAIARQRGDAYYLVSVYGYPPEVIEDVKTISHEHGRGSVIGRTVLARKNVHVTDVLADPEYTNLEMQKKLGLRTVLGVPLLREGNPIGVMSLVRSSVRPFTDKQIELVTTFADQAVIAIENTRLFEEVQASKRELTQALEYQTATSDVLGVIAASPTNIRPVLQTLVDSACRLCAAYDGIILLREGDWLQVRAHHGPIPVNVEKRKITRDWVNGRCVADGVQIHVEDLQAEVAEYPEGAALAQRLGARTILTTPLMREGEAIGAIMIRRDEVRPFSDKQIGLIETFARQAIIAIENTRLFEQVQARTRELTEALDQQTATADVLKAISRSAFDVQKVLDTLIEAAVKLTGAKTGILRSREGDVYPLVASFGLKPEWHELIGQLANAPGHDTLVGRVTLEGRTVQIPDVFADPDFSNVEAARIIGFRANIGTPLHRDGQIIGYMAFQKETVGPFGTRQVELIETFANQAVIAIENARLFEEVQARTRELAKTVEDLEIASQHKNQFVANMSHELRTPLAAILGYAELIQEGFYEPQGPKSLDALTRIRSNGKHLLGLINTVLDIAKIESGQFTLNMGEYAIDSVVETVRVATESLAQNKKLTLTTEVVKSLPIGLGDEQRLTQVLLNLVGNAIKFTDTGEVRVTAKAVNGHFNVTVTDTGPGIPPAEQTRIFEQFHQVDSSLTKAKGGTGLGLAIAKQIVEMHGGRIWVDSIPGKGATFQMELPIVAENRKAMA